MDPTLTESRPNIITGASHSAPISFQVPEIRRLTGEEQKEVCKLAIMAASSQLRFDRSQARCYVSNQVIVDSELAPGMYDVRGVAIMNFDGAIPPDVVSEKAVELVGKTATATASGKRPRCRATRPNHIYRPHRPCFCCCFRFPHRRCTATE